MELSYQTKNFKMDYNQTHLFSVDYAKSVDKKEAIKETLQCMNDLSHILKKVLNFELKKGNLVESASRGWPHKESVFIMLESKFYKEYESITYQELKGPQYGWAEYSCNNLLYVLASPLY